VTAQQEELVRRFYAAWSANDVDGVLAVVHPEIEFHPILGALYEQRGFYGHEGMAEHVRVLHERWDTFEAEVEQLREVGDGLVGFLRLRATRGGEPLEARIAVEVGFRDGLISSFVGLDYYETAEELGVSLD
jgi:ketosteroid isomerase-like protein